mmetsp:Transcript_32670/g.92678  ORF Transcript_32670/g.92678 Transcript_32670/m.92678 type:complete len:252 (+) Transcript_32670:118-873(+)
MQGRVSSRHGAPNGGLPRSPSFDSSAWQQQQRQRHGELDWLALPASAWECVLQLLVASSGSVDSLGRAAASCRALQDTVGTVAARLLQEADSRDPAARAMLYHIGVSSYTARCRSPMLPPSSSGWKPSSLLQLAWLHGNASLANWQACGAPKRPQPVQPLHAGHPQRTILVRPGPSGSRTAEGDDGPCGLPTAAIPGVRRVSVQGLQDMFCPEMELGTEGVPARWPCHCHRWHKQGASGFVALKLPLVCIS